MQTQIDAFDWTMLGLLDFYWQMPCSWFTCTFFNDNPLDHRVHERKKQKYSVPLWKYDCTIPYSDCFPFSFQVQVNNRLWISWRFFFATKKNMLKMGIIRVRSCSFDIWIEYERNLRFIASNLVGKKIFKHI